MSDLSSDIRYALRSLRHSPLHTVLTVLILGVGIGAVTLMFSVLNATVLQPLPYPDPDRLVWGTEGPEMYLPIFGQHDTSYYRRSQDFLVNRFDFLTEKDKANILGGNALRLLKIEET